MTEKQRLQALLSKQETTIQRAFMQFVDGLKSEAVIKQINDAIELSDYTTAFKIIESHIVAFANVMPAVFSSVATAEAAVYMSQVEGSAMAIAFDPTNFRAAEKARQARYDLIRGLTTQQQQATQQAIANAFETGFDPRKVARAIRDSIGLTAQQELTVRRYSDLLRKGSKEALSRQLRDRRFDRTVTNSIRDDKPLSEEQIDKMTDAYRKSLLRFRSEVVARTQSLRATSEARQESLEQVMALVADTHEAIRTWDATGDNRTRAHHASMDHQEVGLDQPFVDGKGNMLRYPGDPAAPADTVIECRCTFSVKIREKEPTT